MGNTANKGFITDNKIDITGLVCPMTFVRTKLRIEELAPGDILDVRLVGAEPLKNVPRSAREHGHEVLSIEPEGDDRSPNGVHHVLIRKSKG